MNRSRRDFLKLAALIAAVQALAIANGVEPHSKQTEPVAKARKPNIIMILMDDMGWRDLGCFGSKWYESPRIDALCAQGMKFTSAYAAAPLCSPTRASLMTGKSPARLHLTDFIIGSDKPWTPHWTKYLDPREVTIAEILKEHGYATGIVGKWHLADHSSKDAAAKRAQQPDRQGFGFVSGVAGRGQPPGTGDKNGGGYFGPFTGLIPDQDFPRGSATDYITDRLGDEALKFIEHNKAQPFFLYYANYAVHTPLFGKPDLVAKYSAKPPVDGQTNPVFAAMLESADQNLGRLVDKLQELRLMENTLILFMSDNGGDVKSTDNSPLRAGKASNYEGGVRVPMFAVWRGTIAAGTSCDVPIISTDFPPTILAMLGLPPRPECHLDGVSFAPLLKGGTSLARDALYWHYPHANGNGGATPFSAIRKGDWRFIEWLTEDKVELYNMNNDLSETHDMSKEKPELVQELLVSVHKWQEEVGAQKMEKTAKSGKQSQPVKTDNADEQ